MLDEFGFVQDDEVVTDLADDLRSSAPALGRWDDAGALMAAERCGFGRVAGRCPAGAAPGWADAIPLFGTEAVLGMSSGRSRQEWACSISAGWSRKRQRASSPPRRSIPTPGCSTPFPTSAWKASSAS